jgi:DNA repair photolyase
VPGNCIEIQYTGGVSDIDRHHVRIGRGAASNPPGRFEVLRPEPVDDGWGGLEAPLPELATTVQADSARSIIARNKSPDIPFSQSINPYRGCEHGCVYCYARPSHATLNLSPGLDFETRLFYKPNAAELLIAELGARNYRCSPIALGANTDPYQPIERRYRLTRQILETLAACEHPATIVTKGAALIARDLDLLADMARRSLIAVYVSVTTLDDALKRRLEPRAAGPAARLAIIEKLAGAGVPVGLLVAPVIPVLTDHEIERILEAGAAAGAAAASYILLRLPHELSPLFRQWLDDHEPLKAAHVMSRIHELRGGRDNDPRFGSRHRGEGEFARLFAQRFAIACRRYGFRDRLPPLDTSRFVAPRPSHPQQSLF